METLALYTIIALSAAAALFIIATKWTVVTEHRRLRRILKNGREFEAVVVEARPIHASVLRPENVRLKIQLLTQKSVEIRFNYDASYPEWRELAVGKIITVDIDPADHRVVLITRKSSRFNPVSAGMRAGELLAA
nr:hypothetical protein [uncultured Dyadobacter sp.]